MSKKNILAVRAAKRALKHTARQIRKYRKGSLSGPAILRQQLIKAAQATQLIASDKTFAKAMAELAKDYDVESARADASPNLALVRFFELDPKTTTANRNAAVLDICLQKGWSMNKIKEEITLRGPTALLAAHHKKKRRLRS